MNLIFLKTILKIRRLFRKKIDMNLVIEENLNLMKEIRAKRIRVYRLSKEAKLHFKS
jgi:hypothetical protein